MLWLPEGLEMHKIVKALMVSVGDEPASPGQTSTQAALLRPAVLLNEASEVINCIRLFNTGKKAAKKKLSGNGLSRLLQQVGSPWTAVPRLNFVGKNSAQAGVLVRSLHRGPAASFNNA
jgi:hypothetical protein